MSERDLYQRSMVQQEQEQQRRRLNCKYIALSIRNYLIAHRTYTVGQKKKWQTITNQPPPPPSASRIKEEEEEWNPVALLIALINSQFFASQIPLLISNLSSNYSLSPWPLI